MQGKQKRLFAFLLVHLAILLYGVFILLLLSVSRRIGGGYFCLSHDLLRIYCPFCGGTRALSSLFRLDLLSALCSHAALVITLPLLVFLDARALCLILFGREDRRLFPTWARITVISLFLVYFILRNLLMLTVGFDPTGDFR